MLGDPTNPFSLTRAALSARGGAKCVFLSFFIQTCQKYMSLATVALPVLALFATADAIAPKVHAADAGDPLDPVYFAQPSEFPRTSYIENPFPQNGSIVGMDADGDHPVALWQAGVAFTFRNDFSNIISTNFFGAGESGIAVIDPSYASKGAKYAVGMPSGIRFYDKDSRFLGETTINGVTDLINIAWDPTWQRILILRDTNGEIGTIDKAGNYTVLMADTGTTRYIKSICLPDNSYDLICRSGVFTRVNKSTGQVDSYDDLSSNLSGTCGVFLSDRTIQVAPNNRIFTYEPTSLQTNGLVKHSPEPFPFAFTIPAELAGMPLTGPTFYVPLVYARNLQLEVSPALTAAFSPALNGSDYTAITNGNRLMIQLISGAAQNKFMRGFRPAN